MFFLLAKEEGIWDSSTTSTQRYRITNDAVSQVESEGKNKGLRMLELPGEISGENFEKCIPSVSPKGFPLAILDH